MGLLKAACQSVSTQSKQGLLEAVRAVGQGRMAENSWIGRGVAWDGFSQHPGGAGAGFRAGQVHALSQPLLPLGCLICWPAFAVRM